jgi:hypothetical protein
MTSNDDITLEALYPRLTPDEQREAAENLERYLGVILRIAETIRRDPERYREFCALTGFEFDPNMATDEPIIRF